MSLLDIIICAHPVRLCGRVYLCRERTIGLMAYFEALALAARGTEPPPWCQSELSVTERRQRMREAFNAAEKGEDLPSWGASEVTAVLLGTEIGRHEYLRRVLADSQLTPGQIVALDEEMGPDDWTTLLEATGPRDALIRADNAILEELGLLEYVREAKTQHQPPTPGEATPFRAAIAAVCKQLGCQPASLSDWTLSELGFVCNEGRPPMVDHACPPGVARKDWDPKVMNAIYDFWHEKPAEPTAASGEVHSAP